jgi:SAM-dependent methyltransferase
MNLEYSEIFNLRGAMYHRAMQNHPEARAEEFRQLFARAPLSGGEQVLDVPSGGGYLARWLPPSASVTELELSRGFKPESRVVETYGDWDIGTFDRAVTLAGLHHIGEQDRFVGQMVRHVRPGGIVHIADVDADTPLPRFLDGFIGRYNITGHNGLYIQGGSFKAIPGTRVLASELRACPWRFPDMDALLDFSGDLFGVVNCPRRALAAALEEVGIEGDAAGTVLNWRLRYIDLEVL